MPNDFIGRSLLFIRENSIDILIVILLLMLILIYKVILSEQYGGWYGVREKQLEKEYEERRKNKHITKEIIIEGMDVRAEAEAEDLENDKETNDIMNKVKNNFCELHKGESHVLEEHCSKLSTNNCKTSGCCVLIGGKNKCVAGDKHGPTYHTDENEMPLNFEYYYYENKCYGEKCNNE